MRHKDLLFLLAVVLTCGLIAGCGDDDSTTSTAPETKTTESTTSEDTEATNEDSDGSSSDIDSEGVYNACVDAVSGTPGEAAVETLCVKGVVAKFEQCATKAESLPEDSAARDDAIAICQDAADQGIKVLEDAR